MKKHFLILLFFCLGLLLYGQSTYEHISNRNIYAYLDELASEKFITLNDAIKPYTREFIYERLVELQNQKDQLNERQKKELTYYLDYYSFGNVPGFLPEKDHINLFKKYNRSATSLEHMGYFYSDSVFSFALRPVLGIEYYRNSSGTYKHTYGGMEAFASLTKYLSFYANLRDNTVSEVLSKPGYFSKEPAGNYKRSNTEGSADFSEMRGGMMLSWNFLEVGFVKDHLSWGSNYNGGIIQSGLTPSIPMIKLHIRPAEWFDFNYFHAWLVSDVVDSSLTYILPNGDHRDTYKNKFMAANMFTITPLKGLNLSFGNSIIYSDQNVNVAYLIPVFFYKSVDHTLTSTKIVNQNSQMFFDVSSRLIKHTHLFFTVFVDEFSTRRISDPETHNFHSYKLGGRISNWPIRNISFTGEYYKSLPVTYKHIVPTATYETNSYNMGPWLRDNSEETFFELQWHPLPRLYSSYSFSDARHANEYQYLNGRDAVAYPVLKDNTWKNTTHAVFCSYEFLTGCYLTMEYRMSNTQGYDADGKTAQDYLDAFSPYFFQGRKNTFMLRILFGI